VFPVVERAKRMFDGFKDGGANRTARGYGAGGSPNGVEAERVSLAHLCIFLEEIPVSAREIAIPLKEIAISFFDLCISRGDLPISGEEIGNSLRKTPAAKRGQSWGKRAGCWQGAE